LNLNPTSFHDLNLNEPLLLALAAEGYAAPTPIQAAAIPPLLAGRDLLGCAQTGTGKTAAFALPILQQLDRVRSPAVPGAPRILVLAPTRELAAQIDESFGVYGRHVRFRQAVIYGGVGQGPQVQALRRGVHVLVATPGRLLDLMQQGHLRLDRLEVFVLDEADRMLDMGFLPDLQRIIARLPRERQSLFFSATMPPGIAALARSLLSDPVKVEVAPPATTVESIEQRVHFVNTKDKRALLGHLLDADGHERVLVFTRTKHGADKVAKQLAQGGHSAAAIHGNKSQANRQRTLLLFRQGKLRVLVATDLAARGLDVEGISHVINYDLPHEPESYVHRIGRTGRAGAAGIAVSFCDSSERDSLRAIEKLVRRPIRVDAGHPFHPAGGIEPAAPVARPRLRPGDRGLGGPGRPGKRKRAKRDGHTARQQVRPSKTGGPAAVAGRPLGRFKAGKRRPAVSRAL
jgi:ATP-dependent RNA helicase RhlE